MFAGFLLLLSLGTIADFSDLGIWNSDCGRFNTNTNMKVFVSKHTQKEKQTGKQTGTTDTHTHTHSHACKYKHIRTHVYTHIHTHTNTRSHTFAHTRMHAHTHTHSRHTQAHTHTSHTHTHKTFRAAFPASVKLVTLTLSSLDADQARRWKQCMNDNNPP